MEQITVRTWDDKHYLTLDGNCFTMKWPDQVRTIPLSQVISIEVKDPKGKLRPGTISIRLAGTSSFVDRIGALIASAGATTIAFPHGYKYLEAGHEIQRRFTAYQQTSAASSSTTPSVADEIRKYKELLDQGAITAEEYEMKKRQLLGL